MFDPMELWNGLYRYDMIGAFWSFLFALVLALLFFVSS